MCAPSSRDPSASAETDQDSCAAVKTTRKSHWLQTAEGHFYIILLVSHSAARRLLHVDLTRGTARWRLLIQNANGHHSKKERSSCTQAHGGFKGSVIGHSQSHGPSHLREDRQVRSQEFTWLSSGEMTLLPGGDTAPELRLLDWDLPPQQRRRSLSQASRSSENPSKASTPNPDCLRPSILHLPFEQGHTLILRYKTGD